METLRALMARWREDSALDYKAARSLPARSKARSIHLNLGDQNLRHADELEKALADIPRPQESEKTCSVCDRPMQARLHCSECGTFVALAKATPPEPSRDVTGEPHE